MTRAGATRARSTAAELSRTVLFVDIVDTNALYAALGDARALMHITRCLALLEEQVYEHRGQVIKTIGEELLCLFPDASAAAAAAVAMQQCIENYVNGAAVALKLKIGLHSGSFIEDRGDIFGAAVNIAARLVKLAQSNQIVSDAITVREMRAPLRKRVRLIDRLAVKGNSAELEIMELGWRRRVGAPFTTEQGTLLEQRKAVCITLFFAGLEIAIDASRVPFTIGRDASNDLSVASRKASREHARIEWRRNKFVLFDHSTNGTYVTLAGAPEVIVKHESFLLRGHGTFSLGEAVRPKAPGVIGFECR